MNKISEESTLTHLTEGIVFSQIENYFKDKYKIVYEEVPNAISIFRGNKILNIINRDDNDIITIEFINYRGINNEGSEITLRHKNSSINMKHSIKCDNENYLNELNYAIENLHIQRNLYFEYVNDLFMELDEKLNFNLQMLKEKNSIFIKNDKNSHIISITPTFVFDKRDKCDISISTLFSSIYRDTLCSKYEVTNIALFFLE